HIPIVEPETNLMRVIHSLAGTRIHRITASYSRPLASSQWIKDRFFQRSRIDVRSERLTIDKNVDATFLIILHQAHALFLCQTWIAAADQPCHRRNCQPCHDQPTSPYIVTHHLIPPLTYYNFLLFVVEGRSLAGVQRGDGHAERD